MKMPQSSRGYQVYQWDLSCTKQAGMVDWSTEYDDDDVVFMCWATVKQL